MESRKKKLEARWITFAALLTAAVCCYGQTVENKAKNTSVFGLKSNLVYDATSSMNLGAEFKIGKKSSLDISGNWNPFTYSNNRKWKHVLVQPEFRLWTRDTFSGHFFGVHSHYAFYNISNLFDPPFAENMNMNRYQGWLIGAGLTYGYRWNFNHRWGLEASVGAGYAYLSYSKYPCSRCEDKTKDGNRNYFGPTKAGLSLIYSFGRKKDVVIPSQSPLEFIPPVIELEEVKMIMPYTPRFIASYIVPEAEAVKERSEEGKAYLDFVAGKSDILPDFRNNAAELGRIRQLVESIKNDGDADITGITIMGYASPEGTYHANYILSEKRAAALKRHIQSYYGFPERIFQVIAKGEDWETLDSLVAVSFMPEKHRILEIIRQTDIFDGRELKLMQLAGGVPYKKMKAELFPQLRRSEYKLNYTVKPFSIEKGKEVFKRKPSNLSLNELFLVANTYDTGSEQFTEIFETAARLFPDSDVANNNAAAGALSRKDIVAAERYLLKVQNQNAAYHNNMGMLYGLKEEWEKANESFRRAKDSENKEAAINMEELKKRK